MGTQLTQECATTTQDIHTSYPVAETLFQQIPTGGTQYFSRLDLRSGFYQIPMDPGSKDYTSFWWKRSLYRFTRLPFGIKQAPAHFQKVMETELGQAGCAEFCKVFIDDILVHSNTFEAHIEHLALVIAALRACGLKIHQGKSCFGLDTIDFIGFDVSPYGLPPQQAKVQALQALPHPRNLAELQCIMGKLRYYACTYDMQYPTISQR